MVITFRLKVSSTCWVSEVDVHVIMQPGGGLTIVFSTFYSVFFMGYLVPWYIRSQRASTTISMGNSSQGRSEIRLAWLVDYMNSLTQFLLFYQ